MSSVLLGLVAASGLFSVALGIVHVSIPALVRYRAAIGGDSDGLPSLGSIGSGAVRYELRRGDLVGIAWIMSNAASYVLVSIGLVDLAWATGSTLVPIQPVALWIAGWWALRAAGQRWSVGGRSTLPSSAGSPRSRFSMSSSRFRESGG